MTVAHESGPLALRTAYDWLTSLRPRGIQLGLERVEAALARLGDPHHRLRAVTIAGTNGKGSVAAFLASVVHSSGARVGLYTSPHLVDVTERIKVGGVAVLPGEFAQLAGRLRAAIEPSAAGPGIPLTFFEALTVMALDYFAAREVDLCVLEVGLGGRLDATAVVPPLVGVITPIGLDHTAILGNTRAAICREKVGILRRGTTLVTNVDATLFRDVVGPRAFELRCPIRRAGVDFVHQWLPQGFRYRGWIHRVGPTRLGVRGVHQGDNAALACAAIEALGAHGIGMKPHLIADGLLRARHRGRLERRAASYHQGDAWPAMLIDGAHNPLGARTLARHVEAFLPERPRILLFGVNPDKDIEAMLGELGAHADGIVLTGTPQRPVTQPQRALVAARGVCDQVTWEADPVRALTLSRRLAGADGGVLVAGSLFLVGAVLPHLPAGG